MIIKFPQESTSYELSENLSAGDLVRIFNDGGTPKIAGLEAGSTGSGQQFTADAIVSPKVCQLDENKILIVWNEGNAINAIAGTISGTSISFGLELQISPASCYYLDCEQLDTDKAVVAFGDTSDTDGTAVIVTASGTTLSKGSEYDFDTSARPNEIGLAKLSTTKFAVGWQDATGNLATVAVGTVSSGTVISFGAAVALTASSSVVTSGHCIIKIRDDYFAMQWVESTDLKIALCSVSDNTVIHEKTFTFVDHTTLEGQSAIIRLGDNRFVSLFSNSDNSGLTEMALVKVNGNALVFHRQSALAEVELAQFKNGAEQLNDDTFIFVGYNDANETYISVKCYVEDDIIKLFDPVEFETSDTIGDLGVTKSDSDGNYTIIIDNDTSANGEAIQIIAQDFEKCGGVLKETGTIGQTKEITVNGDINSNQSFSAADVGKRVFIQSDATPGTDPTGFDIGRVLSTAKMTFEG